MAQAQRKIPAPAVTPETKPFWDAAADGRLVIKQCTACGQSHHYPRTICPFCGSDATEWRPASGRGKVYNKTDLLKSARDKDAVYEHQEDTEQSVRVWGDTAVITALLWVSGKGAQDGKTFDYKLWFSDTYVRTSGGWRYVFGQASLPLPKAP